MDRESILIPQGIEKIGGQCAVIHIGTGAHSRRRDDVAWITALIGFTVALIAEFKFNPNHFRQWMGWSTSLNSLENTDITLAVSTISIVVICSVWFFATAWFYRFSSPEHHQRIDRFIQNLQTPIDAKKDGIANLDQAIYRLIGGLCEVYGCFILLLMLIPNSPQGRLCFLFCGGTILVLGIVLRSKSGTPQHVRDNPAVHREKDRLSAKT